MILAQVALGHRFHYLENFCEVTKSDRDGVYVKVVNTGHELYYFWNDLVEKNTKFYNRNDNPEYFL